MAAPVKVWVICHVDRGMDGREPPKLYGDDIGPFDSEDEARSIADAITEAYRDMDNHHLRYEAREVTHKVVRWQ